MEADRALGGLCQEIWRGVSDLECHRASPFDASSVSEGDISSYQQRHGVNCEPAEAVLGDATQGTERSGERATQLCERRGELARPDVNFPLPVRVLVRSTWWSMWVGIISPNFGSLGGFQRQGLIAIGRPPDLARSQE